jgi:hypothetical protein
MQLYLFSFLFSMDLININKKNKVIMNNSGFSPRANNIDRATTFVGEAGANFCG